MATGRSTQFLWFLGAPFALLLPLAMLASCLWPTGAGAFSTVILAHPLVTMCVASVFIGFAWGLGFLWPHFAFCATRDRKFLFWNRGFLVWCGVSIVGTMGFMFWAMSDMID